MCTATCRVNRALYLTSSNTPTDSTFAIIVVMQCPLLATRNVAKTTAQIQNIIGVGDLY
jgi:hypothetical protein